MVTSGHRRVQENLNLFIAEYVFPCKEFVLVGGAPLDNNVKQ